MTDHKMSSAREMTDLTFEVWEVAIGALIDAGWTVEPCEKSGNWIIHRPDRLDDERHHLFITLSWSR